MVSTRGTGKGRKEQGRKNEGREKRSSQKKKYTEFLHRKKSVDVPYINRQTTLYLARMFS